ncbi:MAG TPA: serine hydrolase domain-containing protein [Gemmatimonadales bacterium]|nr:serine hydrolase domain-containing protein [Gemmatimonadales bacterium]
MKKLRRFCYALAALALPAAGAFAQVAPASPPALTREDLEAWFDVFVPQALTSGDIAGLVVTVVKDGQVLLEKGYGLADVRGKIPMTAGTVVRVASLSKAFTSTAVMQLVERGKIDLDRDINEYLDFKIPAAFGKPITMRNLLSHTAGFEETSYKHYRPPLSLHDHVAMVPDRIFPPGEVPAYSNYGLSLAGYLVSRVSGESIDDYIERHILQPLGMQHSAFRLTLPDSLRTLEARSYALASTGEPYDPALIAEMMPTEAPASGLATTAHDMSRFMLAHLGQGTPILAPTTLALMHESLFVPMPGTQPIALGLFRGDYNGRKAIGHSGDGEGQHADMKILPELGVGVFSAANSDGAVPAGLPAGMALRQRLFEAFMDRYFPAPPAAEEPTAPTAEEHAKLVAGEYIWSRQQQGDYQEALGLVTRYLGLTLTVTANPDGTIATSPFITLAQDGKPRTWREVGPFVWREVDGKARLFAKVENAKVISVLSDAMASSWVNLKVPTLRSAGFNVPLLGMSFIVMLLVALAWPIGIFLRRRSSRVEPEPISSRLTKLSCVLGVIYLLGWFVVLAQDWASQVGSEPKVRVIQIIGLLCALGTAAALWNVAEARGAGRKALALVTAGALLFLTWFSFAFHLISPRIN